MPVYREKLRYTTQGHGHMLDLTQDVAKVCNRAGVSDGLVNLFVVGSTAAIGTIEFEPGLLKDFPNLLDKLAPPGRNYAHEATWHDGNGHSHLQATLLGPSLTIPLESGALALGQWQQVFLIECDVRSRQRTVIVSVLS
ncbi:MAG: secondary thiamine-phosphate synthase enzyme YjbQ [Thermogutta sp.]|nr:secondary thiamine-phosphate synthase enzyme YjbQ [Thermogutta sp.]HOP75935.1 secondary thiamine-phosphate synthase enzyme YjbQ [Thermogutta sp.]HPZ82488.1 secondary thiamine-phosphate synthase enzyme YjbQ [Thermogutta sp.]